VGGDITGGEVTGKGMDIWRHRTVTN
jgi:hypothetical protein